MTIPISGIEVFLAIVRAGSMQAASKKLGVGASAVSHRLKALEQELGVDLLVRTTRSIELTAAGRTLLQTAAPAYDTLTAAVQQSRAVGASRTGTLRLTLPWSAYKIVFRPILSEFQKTYPDIRLDFSLNESLVDIVHEGFHAGVRLGDRLAPGMVAFRLTGNLQGSYFASPGYFHQYSRPQTPQDLLQHRSIRYRFSTANRLADWRFADQDQEMSVDPPSQLDFDSFERVVEAACDGHGIGWALRDVIEDHLSARRLETILEPFTCGHPPFYLYYPEQNRRLELLRVLIDFLKANASKSR
ncbi:MAG: LysR family transcriptional regulator [Roseibium sp.]|uniref:LysR family transcriptional regulator n=1 Tax=Roseibium sp. TaxID=1936156 RepID=UPI0026340FF4|nr:LysR family transcriptional regulator [Roseibium sp.]MCV0427012.1 LysR family transcriptional regulator [Roseibium sp.]